MDTRTREVRPGRGYSLVEDNPDRIKENIDRTRADLDETVDELSSRLSLRRLTNEFMDMFMHREDRPGAEPRTRDVLRAVRENPVPASLIGAGIAWFLFERTRPAQRMIGREGREVGSYRERDWLAPGAEFEPDEHHGERGHLRGKMRERTEGMMEAGRERLSDAGHSMRSWAQRAGESISHGTREVGERVSRSAEKMRSAEGPHLRERARGLRHKAEDLGHRAGDTARNIRDTVEDHPLIIGAAALGVGLLAALAAPSTRREREVFGPARDELLDEAARFGREEVAPQVRGAAQEVAQRTGEALAGKASEEIDDEGASMGERASKVAGAGIHAAGEAVRDQLHREGEHPEPGPAQPEAGSPEHSTPPRRIEPDNI